MPKTSSDTIDFLKPVFDASPGYAATSSAQVAPPSWLTTMRYRAAAGMELSRYMTKTSSPEAPNARMS